MSDCQLYKKASTS